MYSDGDRKTVSELQREAEVTRKEIVDEAQRIEGVRRSIAKVRFSISQLFDFFAKDVETEEDRKLLVYLLMNDPPSLHLETISPLPIIITLANCRLPNARSFFFTGNHHLDDPLLTFFVHTLRFCPHARQVNFVDVSGTAVTERGMCHVLEMMIERRAAFTLVAKNIPAAPTDSESEHTKYLSLLSALRGWKLCTIVLQ